MNSLAGAPQIGKAGRGKPVPVPVFSDDDIPEVRNMPVKKADVKRDKGNKKDKKEQPVDKAPSAVAAVSTSSPAAGSDYASDFESEPVGSESSLIARQQEEQRQQQQRDEREAEERRKAAEREKQQHEEMRLEAARKQAEHDRLVREWNQKQKQEEKEAERRERRRDDVRAESASDPLQRSSGSVHLGDKTPQQNSPPHQTAAPLTTGLPPELNEQLLQLLQQQIGQQSSKQDVAVLSEEGKRREREKERRRRRERDRERDQLRMHDEEAAHSMFHRLAKDVREIFHDLNAAVVAAERERQTKDDRYRKEREAHDAREEANRRERDAKDRSEREEREAKYWQMLEEREMRFRDTVSNSFRREETERDDRLRREAEDKAARLRSDRELRDEIIRQDALRREKEDAAARERDHIMMTAQVDEIRAQHTAQLEEMRRQIDLDRAHTAEMHKHEIAAMERRYTEASSLTEKHHREQLALMDMHTSNADKLEKLIKQAHLELSATQNMHQELMDERTAVMREREAQLDTQRRHVDAVLGELQLMKESMEKERLRLASLYSQFDIAIASFVKQNDEDRKRNLESQTHLEVLKAQAEKDRKQMLNEVFHERKLLEQQHADFVAEKMQVLSEIQAERQAISKERSDWMACKERNNRDETALLCSLRQREAELSAKIESIESNRADAADMKREAAAIQEACKKEREDLRVQRTQFEQEKDEILNRVTAVHHKAEEAVQTHIRLRKDLSDEKVFERSTGISSHGGKSPPHPSAFFADLARQRAILGRIRDVHESPF